MRKFLAAWVEDITPSTNAVAVVVDEPVGATRRSHPIDWVVCLFQAVLLATLVVGASHRATASPQAFPLLCRGGVQLGLEVDLNAQTMLNLYFQPATTAATQDNLPPAHCGWLDRGMRATEPTVICIAAAGFGDSWNISTHNIPGTTIAVQQIPFLVAMAHPDQFYTFSVFNDGNGCLRSPALDLTERAAAFPNVSGQSYPLVCRGGGSLQLYDDSNLSFFFIAFRKAAQRAPSLAPGECSWLDRGMWDSEPAWLCQPTSDRHDQWWEGHELQITSRTTDISYVNMLQYSDRYVELEVFNSGPIGVPPNECLVVTRYRGLFPNG